MSLIKSKFIAINDGCFITDTFTTRGGVCLKNPPLGAAKQKYFDLYGWKPLCKKV